MKYYLLQQPTEKVLTQESEESIRIRQQKEAKRKAELEDELSLTWDKAQKTTHTYVSHTIMPTSSPIV